MESEPIVQTESIANTALNPNAAVQACKKREASRVLAVVTEKRQPWLTQRAKKQHRSVGLSVRLWWDIGGRAGHPART